MLNKILDFIKNEPVRFGGLVIALIQSLIGLLVAFNVSMTPEQQAAVIGVAGSLIAITVVIAEITRNNVTPVINPKSNNGVELVEKQ